MAGATPPIVGTFICRTRRSLLGSSAAVIVAKTEPAARIMLAAMT